MYAPSFASRFIIEKPLSAIHVSLKTRQTRRSTRSLPPLQDCISDYIIELRIPGEWFQTLVIYERNLELCYFNALCSKLDGALRSQKRLGTSRDGKVSCSKSSRSSPPPPPSSDLCSLLKLILSSGKKFTIENSACKRMIKKLYRYWKVEMKIRKGRDKKDTNFSIFQIFIMFRLIQETQIYYFNNILFYY